MSLEHRFRSLLLCAVIGVGLSAGAPMHPDEIQELLQQLNQPKVAQALRQEEEDDETLVE